MTTPHSLDALCIAAREVGCVIVYSPPRDVSDSYPSSLPMRLELVPADEVPAFAPVHVRGRRRQYRGTRAV